MNFDQITNLFSQLYHFILFCLYCLSEQRPLQLVLHGPNILTTDETNAEPSVSAEPVDYEDKYQKELQKLDPYMIFEVNANNKKLLDTECENLINKIKHNKSLMMDFLEWTKQMNATELKTEVAEYIVDTFMEKELLLDDQDQDQDQAPECETNTIKECDEEEEDADKDADKDADTDDFEHVKDVCIVNDISFNLTKLKAKINENLENCETEITKFPSEKLVQLARDEVCNTQLDPLLISNFVMEATPIGNVLMRYNAKNSAFEYFSDRSMPRRYLETVGRKYIITFGCPHLWIDNETEIQLAAEKQKQELAKKKQLEENTKNTNEKNEQSKEVANKSKQIFAKFKSYNKPSAKKGGAGVSMNYNTSTSPFSFKFSVKTDKTHKGIVQERSNCFIYVDKLSFYSPLQKVKSPKKEAMTFAEFKAQFNK